MIFSSGAHEKWQIQNFEHDNVFLLCAFVFNVVVMRAIGFVGQKSQNDER